MDADTRRDLQERRAPHHEQRQRVIAALEDHEMTLDELAAATGLWFADLVPTLDRLVERGQVSWHRDHPEPTLYALAVAR